MSKIHAKNVLSRYFSKILAGEKTYEVRLADWQCEEGDTLELVEIDDNTKQATGRTLTRKVGAVIRTKDIEAMNWWSKEDIEKHGFQIISLVDGDRT